MNVNRTLLCLLSAIGFGFPVYGADLEQRVFSPAVNDIESDELRSLVLRIQAADSAKSGRLAENNLQLHWSKRMLSIRGSFPGGAVPIYYLEAYCRPGSTNRDWKETVIPHESRLGWASSDGRVIRLQDKLADGVEVRHTLVADADSVSFYLRAYNPTKQTSLAHWAQPCVRVGNFTSSPTSDARELYPQYIYNCFLFVDDQLTMLPTSPWADKARYVPGQVYCPAGVNRNDVNPRPLSSHVPSSGLCGCFSADNKFVLAMAWKPFQEIFQGVITCLHNDFRIGGLAPGQTKNIFGKMYFVEADIDSLKNRYRADFGSS